MQHYETLAEVPDSLATRSDLRSWGLVPGGAAVATVSIVAAVSGRRRREPLYRVDQAVAQTLPPAGRRRPAAGG